MSNTRLISIDIARAICIILVVIGHFIPDNAPNWYVTIRGFIYAFHMPLFMFVSGYVYWATRKPSNYKNFVSKKFQRLMIPYFFASIVVITIKLLTEAGLSLENPVEISAFYKMFYLPVAGIYLWFVFALFLIFIIIPFFNTKKKILILLILSLILHFIPVSFPKIFCLAQFKSNLLFFVLGCVLFEWKNVRQIFDKIHHLIALIAFVSIYLLKSYIDINVINNVLGVLTAFFGIIFVSNFSKQIELKTITAKKILVELSLYSYSIYLFHTTFEGFVKAIVFKLNPSMIDLNKQLVFICTAMIVVLAGVIGPIVLHSVIVNYSRLFSFFIGAKYKKAKN